MKIEVGKRYLITTDNWFYAPNGAQHRVVFGKVSAVQNSEETLGIRTNRNATNWYVVIGNMIVAGCQIHYAIQTNECHLGEAEIEVEYEGKLIKQLASSRVYNAGD